MAIVWLTVPICSPPEPLLPPSLTVTESSALAGGASVFAVKVMVLVASLPRSALISASVPVRVTLDVPLPLTIAPLVPAVTSRMP